MSYHRRLAGTTLAGAALALVALASPAAAAQPSTQNTGLPAFCVPGTPGMPNTQCTYFNPANPYGDAYSVPGSYRLYDLCATDMGRVVRHPYKTGECRITRVYEGLTGKYYSYYHLVLTYA